MCFVNVCSVLTSSKITSLENVSYIVFNHVYYTSHLDILLYSLLALRGMIVTLLVSSVSFCFFLFLFFVDGVPLFVFATLIN